MELKEGMVVKSSEGDLYLLINGHSGQYGMGMDWSAHPVQKISHEGEIVLDTRQSIYIDSINDRDKYSFYTFVQPRYYIDYQRTENYRSDTQKALATKAAEKLLPEELEALKLSFKEGESSGKK